MDKKDEKELTCPVMMIAAAVKRTQCGTLCIGEQCAWWNKPCKCCVIKLI